MKTIVSNSGKEYHKIKIGKGKKVYMDKYGNLANPYDLSEWGGFKKHTKSE